MCRLVGLLLALGCVGTAALPVAADGVEAAAQAEAFTFEVLTDAEWDAEEWTWSKSGYGGGIGFRKDGWILTTAHQVKDARSLVLICPDGCGRKADDWLWLETFDIGLIHVPDYEVPVPRVVASATLRQGQRVYAMGRPFGYAGALTSGIVSRLNADLLVAGKRPNPFQGYILTDAQANPGSSGGPLLDEEGDLVGMMVASLSVTKSDAPGMSFAMPAEVAWAVADRLLSEREAFRSGSITAWFTNCSQLPPSVREKLGIKSPRGVVLLGVGGTAKEAGLRDGDVVLAVGQVQIQRWMQLRVQLAMRKPGDTVEMHVEREGETRTHRVALEAWEDT